MAHAFTGTVDVAQLVLYGFWLFFAGLIYYLHRENKREGYPLETERSGNGRRLTVSGFPAVPPPKVFKSHDGTVFVAPEYSHDRGDAPVAASAVWPGAAFAPVGDPMRGVGPASYAARADVPELGMSGQAILMPLRKALAHSVAPDGPNPAGMAVHGRDGVVAGTVVDVWIDEAESLIRYLEVDVGQGTRLLPMAMARVRPARRVVDVASITAAEFAGVPAIKAEDEVTKLEEDMIAAYFSGGHLYSAGRRARAVAAGSRWLP